MHYSTFRPKCIFNNDDYFLRRKLHFELFIYKPFVTSIDPKAAILFWFFGDFRCGVLLFIVVFVKYINTETGIKIDVKC